MKTPLEYFNRWPKYFGPKAGAIDILIRYGDGTPDDWRHSSGCCGHMRFINNPKNISSVYASLWCRNEEYYDIACDYWNYLLGADSPYRLALKDLQRIYDDKGRPIAFGLHDMDAPLQLCLSVMIQCRIPQEQVSKLRSYKHWRDNGFSQTQAFFLSEHFLMFDNGELGAIPLHSYHHGFEPRVGISYTMLRDGTPQYALTSWSKGDTVYDQPQKHYYIWGKTVSKVYTLLSAPQKYTGNFEEAFKKVVDAGLKLTNDGVANKDQAVKILRDNINEWAPNA